MTWLDAFGWLSSVLVVWSLMVARVLRFRVLNLVGAVIATAVNALVGLWPFVAMNGAIAVIDAYWIVRLLRERHDAAAYEVLEVAVDDPYLRRFLQRHAAGLTAVHPRFRLEVPGASRRAFLVLRGDETVGVVVVSDAGDGVGLVELDYVSQRFRDFTPGEFVYRQSGVFAAHGFRVLRLVDDVAGSRDYYERVGFRPVDGAWERSVEPA
ncbi:MAG TPA: hypothetical protein VF143_06570 [Candidatus Nanopelagicales bacterium]